MTNTIKPIFKNGILRNCNPEGLEKLIIQEFTQAQKSVASIEKTMSKQTSLILGGSQGYGLSSVITCLANGSDVVVVAFEVSGSAGMENLQILEKLKGQFYPTQTLKVFIGDCFTSSMKIAVSAYLKAEGKSLSNITHSIASGRRVKEGLFDDNGKPQFFFSSLGCVGKEIKGLSVNMETEVMAQVTLPALSQQQIDDTISVMGCEDLTLWCEHLYTEGTTLDGCKGYTLSYLGSEHNEKLYTKGSLGAAKLSLVQGSRDITENTNIDMKVVVCRALTTKAASVIPSFIPYLIALLEVHNEEGLIESTLDQMRSMHNNEHTLDNSGLIRLDEKELLPSVQHEVGKLLKEINKDTFKTYQGYTIFKKQFLQLAGFTC